MYYIDFVYEGQIIDQISHTENDEQVWMDAGLDLLSEQGKVAADLSLSVQYADQALKGSPDYYRDLYGDRYLTTLQFLDSVVELCDSYPDAIIEVRY